MKILVRKWNEEENRLEYVWKQVSNKPHAVKNDVFKTIDGDSYVETEVLKILRDTRKIYNYCCYCGKLVKPGDEEKHFAEKEKSINCFDCRSMTPHPTGTYSKRKYVKQEDGTYMITVKEEVQLYCRAGYNTKTIEEAQKNKSGYCPYFKCRNHGVNPFRETAFMKYPKMHDVLLTEKNLMDNKFSLYYMDDNCRQRIYVHNRLKNLRAVVDDNGIIIKFTYDFKNNRYHFVYSKTYDEFFSVSCSTYEVFSFDWRISNTTIENIEKTIRNMYAEENEGGK